jgi:enoyl-CoA hydratase
VPRARLKHETLELARTIAARPSFALKLAKMSVNHAQDAQGMWTTLQAALGWHHLGHAHNREVHGKLIDPSGVGTIRRGPKSEE